MFRVLICGLLLIPLVLMFPGCSSDDSSPTEPPIDEPPANTPTLPEVSNPGDELPTMSEFMSIESAELGNFSPVLSGLSLARLETLNEALVFDFRLLPSRNALFVDGQPCYPEHLEFTYEADQWHLFERSTSAAPFVALGRFDGSDYYLSQEPTRWFLADVSARNFGGHLASLTSEAENSFVVSAVQDANPGTDFLMGLSDWGQANDDWIWTDGEPVGWYHWAPGEPSNGHGVEFFGHVYSTGTWNDVTHLHVAPFVLERTEPFAELPGDGLACGEYEGSPIFLHNLAYPTETPHIERQIYWRKVFQTAIGAGATYSEEHSYTHGTSETTGMSFGWSIGVSVSASWAFVSAEISTEFHQDFEHEVTVSSEETVTRTYSATAPDDKIMLLALWQLRERFVIVDGEGNPWSDPGFEVDGELPYLDQGLQQEYLQTRLFDPVTEP